MAWKTRRKKHSVGSRRSDDMGIFNIYIKTLLGAAVILNGIVRHMQANPLGLWGMKQCALQKPFEIVQSQI